MDFTIYVIGVAQLGVALMANNHNYLRQGLDQWFHFYNQERHIKPLIIWLRMRFITIFHILLRRLP